MYSDGSEDSTGSGYARISAISSSINSTQDSRGSGYARFSAISSSINSTESIELYTVISSSTSTTYDNISEGYYDRQIGQFITPNSGRHGELPRIRDDNPDHVDQGRHGELPRIRDDNPDHVDQRNSSNQEHIKDSKRPCIIVILSVFAVVISTTVATIAVLYLQGQDSPNDNGNVLSLNRSYLRKINGFEIFGDCKDLKLFGNDSDGLYTVYPDPLTETPIVVYCDMTTDGGGWTVFQHRQNGSVDFYLRLWDIYKHGFGEASGEHWIGNDNLHKLTTLGTTDLYVRLEAFSGDWYYAKYSDFSVADESDGYRLRLKAGSYEGNAGDGMDSHRSLDPSGMKFSTIDRDNDNAPAQCTFARQGAWWYNQCTLTNLNGIYGNGNCLISETCNFWYLLSNSYVGVKTSYMMVRRLDNQYYCAKCPSSK